MVVYDVYLAYVDITPNGQIYYYLKYKICTYSDINSVDYAIDNDIKVEEKYQVVVVPRFAL